MVLTRWRLIAAIALSLVLAIPFVTFISSLVVFPIFVFGALAIFVNAGPILLLGAAALRGAGMRLDTALLLENWQFFTVVWIGCAYGLSHWGDVAQSMGMRNIPYLKVLFAPYLYLLGQPIA